MTPGTHPPLTWVGPDEAFPPTAQAWPEGSGANGLLAAGESVTPDQLVRAYTRGIYPWSGPEEPMLWWSPDPRMVLPVREFRIRRSLRQAIDQAKRSGCDLRLNHDFAGVLSACAEPRPGQAGSWITPAIALAYTELHHRGYAHSISLHDGDQLLGGLYLVSLGEMVFGESMFSRRANASKICLAALVAHLTRQGAPLVDCQQQTEHLASLGARPVPRAEFEGELARLTSRPPLDWRSDALGWPLS
ncbi:MAG: leucyl/phenylalanyl-tRNA--protein transferase [Betaproteobacteria bacterium]|nr:leucyl/phenylalanyl-tRNA--protein transferase [Betaproteobacteria bacterium]